MLSRSIYSNLKKIGFKASYIAILLVSFIGSSSAFSRADYDLDDDGLIEIKSIDDLHQILSQSHLMHRQPYSGCPNQTCIGFELTQDLSFPAELSIKKGIKRPVGYQGVSKQMPAAESSPSHVYWPVIKRFTLIFEGNGHHLSNIRFHEHSKAMFNFASKADFRNITLSMSSKSVRKNAVLVNHASDSEFNNITIKEGYALNGLLVNRVSKSKINQCVIKGEVEGSHGVGLLMGEAKKTVVSNCSIKGKVTARYNVGLIAGKVDNSELNNLAVNGYIVGKYNTAGGVGDVVNSLLNKITVNAAVTGMYSSVGGLVGELKGSDIRNSLFEGNIYGANSKVGGVAGIIIDSHLHENTVNAEVSGQHNLGLIAGSVSNSTIELFKFSGLAKLEQPAVKNAEIKPIEDWFAQQSQTKLSKATYQPILPKKPEAKAWYSSMFD